MTNAYAAQIKFNTATKTNQLRSMLRRKFGDRKYRLTADGEVHVYGCMPNSIVTGWYLLGSKASVMAGYQIM